MLPEKERLIEKEKYDQLKTRSKKAKKRLLIALIVILGVIALMIAAVAVLEKRVSDQPIDEPTYNYVFYSPYDGDILQNEDYIGLDRELDYCDDPSGLGRTVSVNEENRLSFDASVLFFCDYLDTLVYGNATAYNRLFHESYFAKHERVSEFNPQMIYDPLLVFVNEEKDEMDRLVTYQLTYKIYRNDGSFRRDVGSDAARPQNITLRVSANGNISIVDILTIHKNQ